jgi:hypothetical protein
MTRDSRSLGFSRLRGLAALAAVLVLAGAGVLVRMAILRANGSSPFQVHGVRLGMTARDVRDRFVAPGAGHFRSDTAGELAMEWWSEGGSEYFARFEFHSGVLVAARMHLPPADRDAQGRLFDVSSSAVLSRRRASDGRVELTLLARDCPTHAEEVRRLLASR